MSILYVSNTATNTSPVPPSTKLAIASDTIENAGFVWFLVTFNGVVSLVALTLNLIIIMTFAKNSSLRTPSNILVLGLAVSDFGVAAVSQPLLCVWYYGFHTAALFIALRISFDTFVAVSLFVLTAITTDRFLAVFLHLRYQAVVTTQRYLIVLICCWIASILLCVCRFLTKFEALAIDVCVGIISLSFNAFFIIKISREIRRHATQIQAQINSLNNTESLDIPRYKRTVINMYFIIVAPILCYIPFLSSLIGHVMYDDVLSEPAFVYYKAICETITMSSGAINPIIYCIRMEEIRHAVLNLLHAQYCSVFCSCTGELTRRELAKRNDDGNSNSSSKATTIAATTTATTIPTTTTTTTTIAATTTTTPAITTTSIAATIPAITTTSLAATIPTTIPAITTTIVANQQ